jgi:hypothetical protein
MPICHCSNRELETAHIEWLRAIDLDGQTWCKWASRSRSLHHKIFDLGTFTVLPGSRQIVFCRRLHVNGRR